MLWGRVVPEHFGRPGGTSGAALESAYAQSVESSDTAEGLSDEALSFETFPRELTTLEGGVLDAEARLLARHTASSPVLMLERPKLGPLVMEQPMRVYENDVTVKVTAPGRRRSFATVEVTF